MGCRGCHPAHWRDLKKNSRWLLHHQPASVAGLLNHTYTLSFLNPSLAFPVFVDFVFFHVFMSPITQLDIDSLHLRHTMFSLFCRPISWSLMISYHVMSCHVMSYHIISYHIMLTCWFRSVHVGTVQNWVHTHDLKLGTIWCKTWLKHAAIPRPHFCG